jgi:hypothetical protein
MNKIKILSIIIVAIVGTLIFWKRNYLMEKLGLKYSEPNNKPEPTKPTTPAQPQIVYREAKDFPFKLGDMGKPVEAIQLSLNKYWGAKLDNDGKFGKATETALIKAGFGKTLEYTEVAALIKKKQ